MSRAPGVGTEGGRSRRDGPEPGDRDRQNGHKGRGRKGLTTDEAGSDYHVPAETSEDVSSFPDGLGPSPLPS